MTAINPYLSICLVRVVWFARYCGKMYSRHLFSYGGFYLIIVAHEIKQNRNHEYTCKLYGYVALFLLNCLRKMQHKHKEEKLSKNK